MTDATDQAQDAAERAGTSTTARRLVLIGWGAKGLVYVALAYLVTRLALGGSPEEASTTGALAFIAGKPGGAIALVLLGVGLLAFALGRVLEVTVLGQECETKQKALAGVLTVIYLGLAFTAFRIVATSSGSGGQSSSEQGSSFLLGLPGGRILVALVGLGVIAAGCYVAYEGMQQKFLPTLRLSDMPDQVRSATTPLGVVAYVTKGATFVLVGFFFVQSAIAYDPDKARGLDGSLRTVAGQPWGQVVLVAVAVGFLAYGLFCLLESRWRRVGVSASGTA